MKKILSLILSLLLIVGAIPLTAFAEEASQQLNESIEQAEEILPQTAEVTEQGEVSGKCGDNLTWSYDTTSCTLLISGTGDMYNFVLKYEDRNDSTYYYSSAPWGYDYAPYIKSVVINDGVTSIGNYAFYKCSSMTSASTGNSITSIGEYAFYGCSKLTSLTIPNSVTSIGKKAFYSCKALKYNTYGNAKYLGNTSNPYLFLVEATSTSITTANINDNTRFIGEYAFSLCTKLTSLTIPDGVIGIGEYAFANCYSLNYNKYDNAKYIGNTNNPYIYLAEASNTSITTVNINENTKYIATQAFYGCSKLTSVTIPDSVTRIGEQAFIYCSKLTSLTIGNGVTIIGSAAFRYCTELTSVTIGNRVKRIEMNVFWDSTKITDVYYVGSSEAWSEIDIDENGNDAILNANIHYDCYDYYDCKTSGHILDGNSYEVENNTVYNTKECKVCKNKQSSAVSSIIINNYSVSITNASNISIIRYAHGEYTTAGDIKRASGCVTLADNTLQSCITDTVFSRKMADSGVYSYYVKLSDGNEYIFKAELTYFTQELSANDNYLTVSNLYGVSDIFFCMGHYDRWADVKANAKFRATANKINSANSYTYITPGAGEVTVYVKYTDTTRAPEFYYTTLTTPNPTITQDGLNITIDDLTNVKCIKRAFGTYTTNAQVKSAPDVITYGAIVTNGTDSATLHIPHEGALSVMVQYKSGYTTVINVNIEQKRPNFVQDSNKVTIGNLDDLYVIRYAPGTFTKANAIKKAEGSKFLLPSKIDENGEIVIENLKPGTYSFLVQYNEQSINIYTITVS